MTLTGRAARQAQQYRPISWKNINLGNLFPPNSRSPLVPANHRSVSPPHSFTMYNIHYYCAYHPNTSSFPAWLNQPSVRHALYAPKKTHPPCKLHPPRRSSAKNPSLPPAYSILPVILEAGLRVNIYAGDLDLLVIHLSMGAHHPEHGVVWQSKGFSDTRGKIWYE